jgi:hypothetical protein
LGSTTASITLGSGGTIPQTYTDLKLVMSVRKADSTTLSSSYLTFNGSTSSYGTRRVFGNGSGAYSDLNPTGASSLYVGSSNSATSLANTFSNVDVYIPNYTLSRNKSVLSEMVMEDNTAGGYQFLIIGQWSNNAAITSMTITGDASYLAYSTFYLYGIKNS